MSSNRAAYFHIVRPIFWIGLFLLIIEVGLEYRAHLRGWDTLLFGAVRSERKPSASPTKAALEFGPTKEFPFRGPIISGPKSDDAVRIWIASASHGEDIYLPPDSIFPNLIGDELRRQGVSAQILNASRAGTGIDGNLSFLKREFERWRPDVVILYQLSMDIARLSRRFLSPAERKRSRDTTGVAEATSAEPGSKPSRAARLFKASTAYELLNAHITSRLSAATLLSDDLGARAKNEFRRTLIKFVHEVRSLGAEPVLCTFSISASPSSAAPIPGDVELFVHRWNEHLSARGWLKAVEQLNGVIKDVAEEMHVLVIDAALELTGREHLFRDPVHFSLAGHRVLARNIAAAMSERTMQSSGAKR